MSPLSLGATFRLGVAAIWAALHVFQYGMAVSALNGIQDGLVCKKGGETLSDLSLAILPGQRLRPCLEMTASRLIPH
jgi:hypothetical protein